MGQKNIFLIRGLVRESGHWGDYINSLREELPDYSVHTLDILGTGVNHKKKSPITIRGIVDHLRDEYLQLTTPSKDNYIVAISLGGMIAMEWAQHYPHDFKKGVLINTSVGRICSFHERLYFKNFPKLLNVAFSKDMNKKEKIVLSLVANTPLNQITDVHKKWVKIQKDRPVSPANSLRQVLAASMFRPKDPTKNTDFLSIVNS